MKIAIIAPRQKDDYLLNDCLDGLFALAEARPNLTVRISPEFVHPFPEAQIQAIELSEEAFIEFAQTADLIILVQRKDGTNFALAETVGAWHKTIFLDGSELGKNHRFDFTIQNEVLHGRYPENGGIDTEMLKRCALYFRREKPYPSGVIPFPYAIQSSYGKYYNPTGPKDIDFVCIFGQDQFPPMRRYAVQILEEYCREHGFSFRTEKTAGYDFSLERKTGRQEFYQLLARAKVGISIGGGGFDTVRFWETLANNCLLITERIDILQPDSEEFNYSRIYQCNNLYDFKYQLEKVGELLQSSYVELDLSGEYQKILARHSSKARVEKLISLSLAAVEQKLTLVKNQTGRCAVVISSCDKYADLWEPFFTLFFRYWPDCPFPVYLISNTKSYNDSRVKTILVGRGGTWSDDVKKVLAEIASPFVIYLQEDYLLQSRVNTVEIENLINYVAKNPVASVRLIGLPNPKYSHANPFNLGEIRSGERYRLSLQGALWRKTSFESLLKNGESGWDMESNGSRRSDSLPEVFLSAKKKKPLLDYYYYTAIKKGKWLPGALALLRREGIVVDVAKRGQHSPLSVFFGRLKNRLSRLRRGN